MSFYPSQNTPKSMLAGTSPQTPLEELTALPQTSKPVSRGPFRGRRGMEGKEGLGGGEEGKGGQRVMGKRRKLGGGIAPWMAHDINITCLRIIMLLFLAKI